MFQTIINDLMLLMVFLLIGFVIREVCKPEQKLFIPAGWYFGWSTCLNPRASGIGNH